jgi:membrane-associated phospholipid phosphatase
MKFRHLIGIAFFLMFGSNILAGTTEHVSTDFPYSLSFEKEAILFSIGGSLTEGAYYYAGKADSPSRSEVESLNRNNVNRFDRSATYNNSQIAESLSYAGHYFFPVALSFMYLDSRVRRNWATVPIMYLEGFIICNMGITDLTKSIVQRNRPYLYNTDLSTQDKLDRGADGKRSFFSGHTSFNFYSATFISKVFWDMNPDSNYRYAFVGVTYAIASFVGYMRYEAGKHYPTDILVGAAVGSLIGYMVPALHLKTLGEMTVNPLIMNNYQGIVLTYNL